MSSQLGATFIPGAGDDYFMPEVVAPSPQRVTPQVPQNMQEGLQRLELEAQTKSSHDPRQPNNAHQREASLSSYVGQTSSALPSNRASGNQAPGADADVRAYQQDNPGRTERLDNMAWDTPSFSPFPKVKGDNIPPSDEDKEEILWNARKHVLHSQNVPMQIIWARDVLLWAEVAQEASKRHASVTGQPRSGTPRIEHELRTDAINIIEYLSRQEHPEALYLSSKWSEFGTFGKRMDKREAFNGYRCAAELGHARSEYRIGMLFEQSNDMLRAKDHYHRGLSLKDSAATYRLGMMSLLGQHGEMKDHKKGLDLIQNAADMADEDAPQAAFVYGMLLARDLPDIEVPDHLLPTDMQSAKMYVEKAAYLGFDKAQLKMGQAYELCQLNCELNPSCSLHYYGLAARQGLPEAALGVSRWFLFGYEDAFEKNEELAFRYAQEAASAKLSTGAFAIGYYYEIGIHVHRNISEAQRWYQEAADQGNADALGRLESLKQHHSLSKTDHETTTLTRIKSQHGSQRGKRPDRFRQNNLMPTVTESAANDAAARLPAQMSPQVSPGLHPTIVSGQAAIPDPSRASVVGNDRLPAFNLRLDDPAAPPPRRPRSAAPYPEDDPQPSAVNVGRPKSAAPYPEDDVRVHPHLAQGGGQRPHADRPGSAFGIAPQGGRPMPHSQSMGNLQPPSLHSDPRGRVTSWADPGQRRQPSPGPGPGPRAGSGRPFSSAAVPNPRPVSAVPHSNGGFHDSNRPPQPAKGYPSLGEPSLPVLPPAGNGAGGRPYDPRPPTGDFSQQGYRHDSRRPPSSGRPERVSSFVPPQDGRQSTMSAPSTGSRPPMMSGAARPVQTPPSHPGHGGSSRLGSAPPVAPGHPQQRRPSPGPGTPGVAPPQSAPKPSSASKPGKGPATFEAMGIPQGKQDSDCIIM